jgi:hypothetical protein
MISSLDHCKREMEAERAGGGGGGVNTEVLGSNTGGTIDVSKMSWTERERVLRRTFARMNASAPKASGVGAGGTAMDGAVSEAAPPRII